MPTTVMLTFPVPPNDKALEDVHYRDHWHLSYALCNLYQDGQEGVGPHAGEFPITGFVLLWPCQSASCVTTDHGSK